MEDVGPGDVHRHQVGSELDSAEFERHRLGELGDEERLGQAGNAHQERVPSGEQADGQSFDHRMLTDDDTSQLFAELVVDASKLVDRLYVVVAQ
jgi:hypothetical protein